MSLTKSQFDLLRPLAEGETDSAPATAEAAELTARGLLCAGRLTDAGLAALEPYRVRRMVVLAAGFGSRLRPVTLRTPKPLVRVNGRRIIDSLLDAACAAGIEDIVLVRGYLGGQFDGLLEKYPRLRFVENPHFLEMNNISSVDAARDLLAGAYVAEADLLYYEPHLVTRYQYGSNYLAIPTGHTDDWCFHTDAEGNINRIAVGGDECWQMVGLSYWTPEDGARLGRDIHAALEMPDGARLYWDEVPMRLHGGEYRVAVRPCRFGDVIEIDTFEELKTLDPSYADYPDEV